MIGMVETTQDVEPRESAEEWAIRSLAHVAKALEESLGSHWSEWGEGSLADGVRELARQRDAAVGTPTVYVVTRASLGASWVSATYATREAAEEAIAADPQASEYQARITECAVQGPKPKIAPEQCPLTRLPYPDAPKRVRCVHRLDHEGSHEAYWPSRGVVTW